MKLVHHEEGPASPIVQYLTPKMDTALSKVHSLTGISLPIEPEQYPNLIFVTGSLELLGGVLFTLNSKLGATILVSTAVCDCAWNGGGGGGAAATRGAGGQEALTGQSGSQRVSCRSSVTVCDKRNGGCSKPASQPARVS